MNLILSKLLFIIILSSQGCVNEGSDHRFLGKILCPIQRVLSYHSEKEPKFIIHKHNNEGVLTFGISWPPYLILQHHGRNHWDLFRLGWRYDVNWPGYIFPTAALKKVQTPMPKGY